jgi:TPR repeat protein
MNAKVFINYRREDSAPYAGRLYDRLAARLGEDQVFIDIDQIEPGEDFAEVINRKVGTCDIAIVTIGPHWLSATDASGKRRLDNEEDFVRMEIVAALQRKIRVIPVLVGGAQMPQKQDLPQALAPLSRRNAIELSEIRFHADVNRLIEAIENSFAVAEKKTELSATPITPAKGTPTTLPVPSTSWIAALKELKLWASQRQILVSGIVLFLFALAGFLMWLSKPAHADAQFNLGLQYQYGRGVPKDLEKAAELYQKAANRGHARAQLHLGSLYESGLGVTKDLGKAVELYQKAADQGMTPAQNNLGLLYENGQGVPKDLGKARELYQKAADHGYQPAIANLKRLSTRTPTPTPIAANSSPIATPESSPPIQNVPSTNIDKPTLLTSKEIRGNGVGEAISYYYTFNAGPGEVKVTVDGKNKPGLHPSFTGGDSTDAVDVEISDLDAKRLFYIEMDDTTIDKRKVERFQLGRRQPVIMRIFLSKFTLDYMVRLEGPIDFSPATKRPWSILRGNEPGRPHVVFRDKDGTRYTICYEEGDGNSVGIDNSTSLSPEQRNLITLAKGNSSEYTIESGGELGIYLRAGATYAKGHIEERK